MLRIGKRMLEGMVPRINSSPCTSESEIHFVVALNLMCNLNGGQLFIQDNNWSDSVH